MLPNVDERSNARERALYLLYEAQSKGISPSEALELQVIHPGEITELLVVGVERHLLRIDEMIETTADGWAIDRMPVIDLNVMRLAMFELLERPDVPTPVVLNEAVDLAKQFSTDDSGRFVNGVLAAVVPQVRADEAQ